MPKQLNVIDEAQSKSYVQSINKIKDALIKDMGLSNIEANYVTALYTAVKERKIFDSNYFKNFEFEGESFNLNDIQKFAKYPESFYDVVLFVLHSGAFTDRYDINFDGTNVKLSKKDVKKKDKTQKTPFDQFKVAEDENYYTFYMPDYQTAQRFRTFFSTMYPDDEDIKELQGFFFSTWCVVSSGAKRHFNSEKHKKNDIWLVTYRKGNPAERLRQHFDVPSLSNDPEVVSRLLSYDSESEYLKNQLGEIYLMKEDGTIDDYGRNYGYHVYTNSPGSGVEETRLKIPVSYNYGTLDISSEASVASRFTIEDGNLVSCNIDAGNIIVPNGVSTITESAFSDLKKVKQVVLPISTKKIESGAFTNMPKLQVVKVHNTLEVIESGAFRNCPNYTTTMMSALKDQFTWRDASFDVSMFSIGVFSKQKNNDYIVRKPSQLRYAPRDMLKAYKIIQGELDEQEKRVRRGENKKVKKETFRIKRTSYDRTDIYSIEGTKLVIDGDPEDFKNIEELVFPEGIKTIKGSLKKFRNLKRVVFPSTLENFKSLSFGNNDSIEVVNLENSNVKEIHSGAFISMLNLDEAKMPKTLEMIQQRAFYGTGIDSIFIPSTIKLVVDNAFDNCPLLMTIYTDDVEALKSKLTQKLLAKLNKQQIQIEKEH